VRHCFPHSLRFLLPQAVRKVDMEAAAVMAGGASAPGHNPAAPTTAGVGGGAHEAGGPSSPQQQQPPPKPRRNPMDDLKREILIMKRMKHPNVVALSEVRRGCGGVGVRNSSPTPTTHKNSTSLVIQQHTCLRNLQSGC
jgi:hypothetical protein